MGIETGSELSPQDEVLDAARKITFLVDASKMGFELGIVDERTGQALVSWARDYEPSVRRAARLQEQIELHYGSAHIAGDAIPGLLIDFGACLGEFPAYLQRS